MCINLPLRYSRLRLQKAPSWRICFQLEFVLALSLRSTVHELAIKTAQYEVF